MEGKNAILLSGGSMKGAFQVGAFKAIIEYGFYPDFLYGVSVGALNSVFIAAEAGKQFRQNGSLGENQWIAIAAALESFWKDNITGPQSVGIKRSNAQLAWKALFGKFDGMLDMSPVRTLVDRTIHIQDLYDSPLHVEVGTVNVYNGEITYADPITPDFLDYVKASTAIPIMMGGVSINDSVYFDGGLRDVEPLSRAIQANVDNIMCVLCQAESLGTVGLNVGNILHLAERILDIVVNEIVNNDIERALEINKFTQRGVPASEGLFAGKKNIPLVTIRPKSTLHIDIETFDSNDIAGLIELGYQTAKATLKTLSSTYFI